MNKIIIKHNLGNTSQDDLDALDYIHRTIKQGKISGKNNDQYCYVTKFGDNTYVCADRTENGTYVFTVKDRSV